MIQKILIAFFIIHFVLVLKSFLKLKELNRVLHVIVDYLNSATFNRYPPFSLDKKDTYDKFLDILLINYPAICSFSGSYSQPLEYGLPDTETYLRTDSIYKKLMMKRNFLLDDFTKSLNPIRTIQYLYYLPSMLAEWFGFHPGESLSKILSLICWICTYLLGLYSEELKHLITSLFKNFFQA